MSVSEKLVDLDNTVQELELAVEKAWVMISLMSEEYFSLDREVFVVFYHDNAKVLNSIALDYIVGINELTKTVKNLLDSEWDTQKEKSPQSPSK